MAPSAGRRRGCVGAAGGGGGGARSRRRTPALPAEQVAPECGRDSGASRAGGARPANAAACRCANTIARRARARCGERGRRRRADGVVLEVRAPSRTWRSPDHEAAKVEEEAESADGDGRRTIQPRGRCGTSGTAAFCRGGEGNGEEWGNGAEPRPVPLLMAGINGRRRFTSGRGQRGQNKWIHLPRSSYTIALSSTSFLSSARA